MSRVWSGLVWSFVWEGQNTCKSDLNFCIGWEGKVRLVLCSMVVLQYCGLHGVTVAAMTGN